jgi:hypothetical protein
VADGFVGNVAAMNMLLQAWKENKWHLQERLDLNAEDVNMMGTTALYSAVFSATTLAHHNVRKCL